MREEKRREEKRREEKRREEKRREEKRRDEKRREEKRREEKRTEEKRREEKRREEKRGEGNGKGREGKILNSSIHHDLHSSHTVRPRKQTLYPGLLRCLGFTGEWSSQGLVDYEV
jgi:hypothetical protein